LGANATTCRRQAIIITLGANATTCRRQAIIITSLPFGPACYAGSGVASLAALASSTPSASLLPELLTAQKRGPFQQQVDEGVTARGIDQGVWRDFFRNQEGFLCYERDLGCCATMRGCFIEVILTVVKSVSDGLRD
jgi:hypothetical protein